MLNNPVLAAIHSRRSIRQYTREQIAEEELQAILSAGMYAPNAGDQAWHFTVVQNRQLLGRLNLAAKEAAKNFGFEGLRELGDSESFNCLYGAPTLIIVSAEEETIPLEADCAAALQNMLIAAESLGVGSCWIYFVMLAFSSSEGPMLRKELQIPDSAKPYYAAVFGYAATDKPSAAPRKTDMVSYIR